MTDEDWTYLACLIDSEGCIALHRRGERVYVRIQIGQRDPRVLYWLRDTLGEGLIYPKRESFVWVLNKRDVVRQVLQECLPHMKIKPEQAKAGLRLIETGDEKWASLIIRLRKHRFR